MQEQPLVVFFGTLARTKLQGQYQAGCLLLFCEWPTLTSPLQDAAPGVALCPAHGGSTEQSQSQPSEKHTPKLDAGLSATTFRSEPSRFALLPGWSPVLGPLVEDSSSFGRGHHGGFSATPADACCVAELTGVFRDARTMCDDTEGRTDSKLRYHKELGKNQPDQSKAGFRFFLFLLVLTKLMG